MFNIKFPYAAALLGALVLAGHGAAAETSNPHDIRRNATVKAVQRVKPSVVAVKVNQPLSGGRTREMIGTGLIVDPRGYIVTNRHVVAGNQKVIVRLLNRTEISAQVIYADPSTDLAILRVRTGVKLPHQPLVPSIDLEEGEDVIAVGHPYGYQYTVTKGIVSALGRSIDMPTGHTLTGLIQTSTAINPGNSGGPLLNIKGEVIGINVAYREEAQGIAFTISSETVRRVLRTQLSALKLSGVRHGLSCEVQVAGLERESQVVVAKVNSKAAAVHSGDVVLAVSGVPVVNAFDVERALWDARPGQQVPVRVRRGDRQLTVTLTLSPAGSTVASHR